VVCLLSWVVWSGAHVSMASSREDRAKLDRSLAGASPLRSVYNKTYGALGGVIVFLVWLWITNVAILLGAELNAEHERSRELEAGVPGAERELQLGHRSEPKEGKRTRTA
jgi:hypothetical protein